MSFLDLNVCDWIVYELDSYSILYLLIISSINTKDMWPPLLQDRLAALEIEKLYHNS